MAAIRAAGTAQVAALADADPDAAAEAARLAPEAAVAADLDALLDLGLDGVVIATPSALHPAQCLRALEAGTAVLCQKPLGRTAAEARAVVAAARDADRLLGVDLSYRFTAGMERIRALIGEGALGEVFAADLTFHNAYGPDKDWFYDPARSGGGCVMDLGVHLVDLALWALGFPAVAEVAARLFADGAPLEGAGVEDYAVATLTLETGAVVRLACSWRLSAGQDAVIAAEFHGTQGGAAFRNVGGSFYDFEAARFRGTARETLSLPPDPWGGRAACAFAARLAQGARFDPEAERLVAVAEVLDRIYGR
jgi:predicted dehydrogenase